MIFVRFIGLLLDIVFLPLRALLRLRSTVPKGAWVTLELDGSVVDIAPSLPFFQRIASRSRKVISIYGVSRVVDLMVADARVSGIIVTLKSIGTGLAGANSLRAELERLRAAKKEVIVLLPMGGASKEMLLASVATKLVVGPSAQLAPLGFISSTRYLKKALEKAGIEPEVFACGDFKSAGEQLVREDMSAGQRFQLEQMLNRFDEALVSSLASGRGVATEKARSWIDEGPFFGKKAVDAGLADEVAYEDAIFAEKKTISAASYFALSERRLLRRVLRRPVIGVIPVHGTIAHAGGMFQALATDERVIRMVRAARMNRRVKGVVLHVDSPGGSALASDRMHHEIEQLAKEKPLVVCMANVAASGGYYVAAPAKKIIAESLSITGSIGVVGMRFTVDPLMARLGINTESVRRGDRAGLLTNAVPLSDDERAALRGELDATYDRFIGIVANGRQMDPAVVEPLARGRVYTGKDALAVGLVDELGGFRAALKALALGELEPELIRTPKAHLPPLDPAGALVGLLPAREKALVTLLASGERVLTYFDAL